MLESSQKEHLNTGEQLTKYAMLFFVIIYILYLYIYISFYIASFLFIYYFKNKVNNVNIISFKYSYYNIFLITFFVTGQVTCTCLTRAYAILPGYTALTCT
jgi:ABC-type spermidine/putrescine transport system permease subunit I